MVFRFKLVGIINVFETNVLHCQKLLQLYIMLILVYIVSLLINSAKTGFTFAF